MPRLAIVTLLLMAGCGRPAATVTPTPEAPTVTGTFAVQACAGATFDHCAEDVTFAQATYASGKEIAICDAGDGKGSVVALAAGNTAEEACTSDAIDPGPVLRVVRVP
jgi:hypothetical protein